MSGGMTAAKMTACIDCQSIDRIFTQDSMPTLTGANVGVSYVDLSGMNGVIRSSGAIHNFIIFLVSRIATQESCISRLEIVDTDR